MAKKAMGEKNRSQTFKGYYNSRPDLLKVKGYDEVVAMYLADHPGHEMTKSDKQLLANIKTTLRKQSNSGKTYKPKAVKVEKAPVTKANSDDLDQLESVIANCLHQVKQFERKDLVKVVQHLRGARYQLILAIEKELA